jgi:4'-phosphopantetheinyl transferase
MANPMSKARWSFPKHDLSLSPSEVHIWRAWLDEKGPSHADFIEILSSDEIKVASKFFFERDRKRYITSRGTLRCVLGRYLTIDPHEISFVRGQYGKPSLEDHPQLIEFNLSHSKELALFAFTIGHRIGIDVECILPIDDFEQVANFFLSPTEREALAQLPEEIRLKGFYAAWTRKEALTKALGVGIGDAWDKFEVNVSPVEGPAIKKISKDIAGGSNWQLLKVEPDPGYVATLAVETSEISLHFFDYPAGNLPLNEYPPRSLAK